MSDIVCGCFGVSEQNTSSRLEFARLLFFTIDRLSSGASELGSGARANWERRRLKAFSHYTFALDDRQKSLSDSNPPTSTKKCWIKAVLRRGHWQIGLVSLSLSLILKSIQRSDCWRRVCSSLLNPEVSAGPVDKTAEQSPLSYQHKDFTVTFTNIPHSLSHWSSCIMCVHLYCWTMKSW